MGKELSRSEFLKVVSIATAGLVIPPDFPAGVEKPRVLNPLVDANKLPSIEYHSPNFKTVGDKIMTPEVFEAQLDWLKDTNYYTPTSSEVYKYLKGEKILPHPSVMLRFDLGIDKLDENGEKSIWLDVFDNLEKRGLHAHMYLIPDTIEYFENGLKWEDIATYVKKGVISACSHGLKDHPDYRKISENYALESMRISKDNIAKGLLSGGVVNPQILGFAFPFDSVPENPQELIEKGGYYFFAGGTRKNGNNAAIYGNIDEGLPCIYPYVYEENLEAIKINSIRYLKKISKNGKNKGLRKIFSFLLSEEQPYVQ